jgi:hypothetical protein
MSEENVVEAERDDDYGRITVHVGSSSRKRARRAVARS